MNIWTRQELFDAIGWVSVNADNPGVINAQTKDLWGQDGGSPIMTYSSVCESRLVGQRPMLRGVRAVVLVLVGLFTSAGCQSDADLETGSKKADNRAEGEYIVEVADHKGAAGTIRPALSEYDVESISALETNRPLYLVKLASDPGPEVVAKRVENVEGIISVQPNYQYSPGEGMGGTGGSTEQAKPAGQ